MQGSKSNGFVKVKSRSKSSIFRRTFVERKADESCEGKLQYTAERAQKAATNRRKMGKTTEVYRCPHCGFFHLAGGVARRRGK